MPIPEDCCVAVIHSGSSRKLSNSLYNERLSETIEAANQMGCENLSQASVTDLNKLSDETLIKRSHHVISENQRVIAARDALLANDVISLGTVMTESHLSLRDDYEVSSDELDHLHPLHISRSLWCSFNRRWLWRLHHRSHTRRSADEIINAILDNAPKAWLVDSFNLK